MYYTSGMKHMSQMMILVKILEMLKVVKGSNLKLKVAKSKVMKMQMMKKMSESRLYSERNKRHNLEIKIYMSII